jgi:hypothetical protein
MLTKGVWAEIDAAYAGKVRLVVFDFTNQATTDASRADARRLGLESFFDDNYGWTGAIVVLDGATKEELAAIHGGRDFEQYRAAIDAALLRMVTPVHGDMRMFDLPERFALVIDLPNGGFVSGDFTGRPFSDDTDELAVEAW